ncbi:MAG: AraC family transcriptional regulator [Candidatus Baltobacteraceae bacterium]
MPIRSSQFAAILEYHHDFERAPDRAEDKQFQFDNIVVTTRGRWRFHGVFGKTEIDSGFMTVGCAGAGYSCRHLSASPDSNLIAALRSGALDPDHRPLFSRQILPSSGASGILRRAVGSITDDHFDSLLFALFDEASRMSVSRPESSSIDVRMQRAKRFIELHAFERLRVCDIAGELGLSPFTLVRQFRAATGKSPYAYLLELRLERAKLLLSRSDASIQSIAETVGFDDLAHFSAFFKRNTGRSPSSYRAS